jgi:hypothetical protein
MPVVEENAAQCITHPYRSPRSIAQGSIDASPSALRRTTHPTYTECSIRRSPHLLTHPCRTSMRSRCCSKSVMAAMMLCCASREFVT